MKKNAFAMSVVGLVIGSLLTAGAALAAMGNMPGMDHSSMAGNDVKMGDKIFSGKAGAFDVEVRLVDSKATAEAAAKGGMKIDTSKMKSHHVQVRATDAARKPVGKGEATAVVTGPDGKKQTYALMVMADHMGSDVDLAAKGKYAFELTVTAGGQTGTAKFTHAIK